MNNLIFKIGIICITLMLSMLLVACVKEKDGAMKKNETESERVLLNNTDSLSEKAETKPTASAIPDDDDMFSGKDLKAEYEGEEMTELLLSGEGDISVTEAKTYLVSGSLKKGRLVINIPKEEKLRLIFNGVSIENENGAAVFINQADKVFITLAEGSENSLISRGEFINDGETNIDSALFSREDLTLNGSGSLKIISDSGHGIVSKDDLVITGGSYTIEASSHGISGKDSIRIGGGSFDITSGKDGVHAENNDDSSLGYVYIENGSIKINSDGDGISASLDIRITGGEFDINSGDPESVRKNDYSFGGKWGPMGGFNTAEESDSISMKALKAENELTVEEGYFNINSADDAIHSNGNVTLCGGTFHIITCDDGVHADFATIIKAGELIISECYEGIEGETIDIEGGSITIISSDDGLNAAGGNDSSGFGGFFGGSGRPDAFGGSSDSYISISGGIINIDASGDGIDSNGELRVSGGETYVNGPENSGNGALDYQTNAIITGGIFIAAGESGMAQNFGNSSTQGSLLLACNGNESISLKNSKGVEIISFTPSKNCSSVVISCPELILGESYIYECGSISEEFTLNSLIYGGRNSGMGGPGGMGGFGGPGGGYGGGFRP